MFVFRGAIRLMPIAAFIGVIGMVFTAGYTLWKIVQYLFLGSLDRERWAGLADLTWWEKVSVWPLVILMVWLYISGLIFLLGAEINSLMKRIEDEHSPRRVRLLH